LGRPVPLVDVGQPVRRYAEPEDSTLPVTADVPRHVSTVAALAQIPEEEIWLSKQKSARTRRAYRLDVQHFMRTLSMATPSPRFSDTRRPHAGQCPGIEFGHRAVPGTHFGTPANLAHA
jgi:hypothetical protein